MRFGHYISLLGLASKDKAWQSTTDGSTIKNVDVQSTESQHNPSHQPTANKRDITGINTASLTVSPPSFVPKAAFHKKHDHHNHAHAHLHQKKHDNHVSNDIEHSEDQQSEDTIQIPLHPTQKAYLAQAKAKRAAIEKMGQQILMEQQKTKRSFDANHRPLIITNHLQDETVYPAYSSVEQSGGFKIGPGQSHTELLPAGQLTMFRSWIRRGCTEGPGENELHCLTGDCGGRLVCEGWGDYNCGTLAENACFPSGSPSACWVDGSAVQGFITLPITFSMDGCDTVISCDPSSVPCPENMQVKDESGKVLTCACGHSDWSNLQSDCPNSGGAEVQTAIHAACPNIYSFAQSDSWGQKFCPYSDNNAMIIDIGNKQAQTDITTPASTQMAPVNQAVIAEKQSITIPPTQTPPSTATAALVWGPGVDGFDEWAKTYVYNP
jgi:hypothetical protein